MVERSRRSTVEVRALLIAAAERVFSAKGFAAATADDIATEAGVARSAIWRHFDDKSDLFGAAVLQPFVEFLENYRVAYDTNNPDWGDYEITRTIVEIFYDSCLVHRHAIARIATAGDDLDEATMSRLEGQFDRFFDEIMRTTAIQARQRGWVPESGLEQTMRLLFGSIAAIVIFDRPIIFSRNASVDRDGVIDHVTRLFLYGARLAKD
jgi:AcrR family transcriptional regulator